MVYQGLPAGVKVLVKAMSERKKVRRDRFVGSTGHWNSGPGSLSWELCYKPGAGLGEAEERDSSSFGILPGFLAGVTCELAGVACLSWRLG